MERNRCYQGVHCKVERSSPIGKELFLVHYILACRCVTIFFTQSHSCRSITPIQTNCISEPLFHEALADAARLDEFLRTEGKPVGPLHGLHISLKDQFRVAGAETSLGYVG